MKIDACGRFAMLRRTLLELPRGELRVACASGSLWLTLDHDPRDIVLEAGERIALDGRRRVLAYALEDAVLEVAPVSAPAAAGQSARQRLSLQPA
jgi:Protein of unknown function (DUF2917)